MSSNAGAYVLPGALAPIQGESLPGLLMRNARPFVLSNPMHLLDRLQLPQPFGLSHLCRLDPRSPLGADIARLLALDEESYALHSPWHADPLMRNIDGQAVRSEMVATSVRAVCPACLADSPHHRARWLLAAVPACTTHMVMLLDACPSCNHALGWTGVGVHRCRCGFDLRTADAPPVFRFAQTALRSLDRMLSGAEAAPLGLTTARALEVYLTLGLYNHGKEELRTFDNWPSLLAAQRSQLPRLIASGWRALQNWPRNYRVLLGRVKRRIRGAAKTGGLEQCFGRLAALVLSWKRKGWTDALAQEFARYAASQSDVATTAHTLQPYGSGQEIRQSAMTLREAQRYLGVSAAAMKQLADRQGERLMQRPGAAGLPAWVREDALKRLKKLAKRQLSSAGARDILGLSSSSFAALVDEGLVSQAPHEDLVLSARPFSQDAVEAFLRTCVGDARRVSAQEAERLGLWKVASAVRPWRPDFAVYAALADGRLRARGVRDDLPGLRAILLAPTEVEAAVPPPDASALTARMVRQRLQVKPVTLKTWREAGWLPALDGPVGGTSGLLYSQAAVEAFERDFVTGGELARLHGATNGLVSRRLLRLGVPGVSGPSLDRSDMHLFRRADISEEHLRAATWDGVYPMPPHVSQLDRDLLDRAEEAILQKWRGSFDNHMRLRGRLHDSSGRVVVSYIGVRADHEGRFSFRMNHSMYVRLLAEEVQVWLALLVRDGLWFVLAPVAELPCEAELERQDRFDVVFSPRPQGAWSRFALSLPSRL